MNIKEPKDTTYDSVGRVYNFEDARKAYYSVTTMLSKTADHSWLDKWRERVGNEEADRICRAATNLGGPTYIISDSPHKYFSKLRERIIQFRELLEVSNNATAHQ